MWKEGGKLPLHAVLRCKVRYLSDGVALGGRQFLENFFEGRKETGLFGPTRQSGARSMRGADWGEVMAMRDLAKDGVTPS